MKLPGPRTRRYIYRVGVAGIAVLVGYGVLTQEYAVLWIALLAPILGMADVKVPEAPDA